MQDFEAFWAAYPHKVAKAAARKAWMQTKAVRPPVDYLIAAIRDAQAHSKSWRDGYIPHAATWLRGERWEDEFAPTVTKTQTRYTAFMTELLQGNKETIDAEANHGQANPRLLG